MKNKGLIVQLKHFLLLVFMPICMFAYGQTDVGLELLAALKTNNAKSVAELFASNVSLAIENDSGNYSKFQAESILSDFFRGHKTTGVKQMQNTANSGNSFYVVYQITTAQGSFRVFARFNKSSGETKIAELRID